MAFRDCPDLRVPADEDRCEAMTKPVADTYQVWRRQPHRCIRRAIQGRAGRCVCALHARMPEVQYWNGKPDAFQHRRFPGNKT